MAQERDIRSGSTKREFGGIIMEFKEGITIKCPKCKGKLGVLAEGLRINDFKDFDIECKCGYKGKPVEMFE